MSPKKTREEWIAYHDNKSPLDPYRYEQYHSEMFDEENGIVRYVIDNDTMYVTEIIGNWLYWKKILWFLIDSFNIKTVICWTHRENPKAVARLFTMDEIVPEDDDNGGIIYRLIKRIRG